AVAAIAVISGCESEPMACFESEIFVEVGSPIAFSNCSEDAESYEWAFGDGTSSSVKNASKTYVTPGTYTVTLQAKNGSESDEASKTINAIICEYQFFDANFEMEMGNFELP